MGKPIRVLMVEDSENDAKLELHQMRKNGYDPEHDRVETAEAMLTALREKAWDVILCDYQMPQFSGLEAIALLKETGIDIPLIIVSGAIDEGTAIEAMKAGAHDYIMKGNLSRLVPAIVRELEEAESRRKRKQAEAALAESEWKYRIVAENTSDWEFWVDPQARFLYCSPSCLQITGHEAAEFMADPTLINRIIHPDDLANYAEHIMDAQTESHSEEIPYRIIRPDGTERWIGHICQRINDKDGLSMGRRGSNRDITERIKAEEALRESERRFMDVLYASDDAILLIDDSKFVDCNEATARMLGFATREEFLQVHPSQLSPPEQPDGRSSFEKAEEMMRLAFDKGYKRFEWIHRRANGADFPVEVSLTPIIHEGKRLLYCVWRDITEAKRTEENLQRVREQLDLAVQGSNDGIWDWNLRTQELYMSSKWKEQLGYADDELPNVFSTFEELLCPEDKPMVFKFVDRYLKGEIPHYALEFRMRHKAGDFRWILARGAALRGPDGVPYRMAGSHTDITERKRARESLIKSEERFRVLFDESQDAMFTLAPPSWLFTSSNPAALALFGMDRLDEFRALGLWDVSPERQPDGRTSTEKIREMIETAMREGSIFFDWIHKKTDGQTFFATVMFTRMALNDQVFLQATVRDVSRQKAMEMELSHARKLEAVGQLAAGIAHEINTPAQYVGDSIGFLKEAHEDIGRLVKAYRHAVDVTEAGGANQAFVEQIRATEKEVDIEYLLTNIPASIDRVIDGVGRISSIVRAMKEFAHPDQRDQSPADLNQAITTTMTIARNEYKYVADIETDFGELPTVMCHLGDLNQVFLNLIVNAAHAIADVVGNTNTKGTIRIRTRTAGECVRIDISDNGKGIPKVIRDRIFEPFFTTKPVGKGSGQGLAIARSIVVDKHAGSLTFESAIGQGTTFTMQLPIEGTKNSGKGLLS